MKAEIRKEMEKQIRLKAGRVDKCKWSENEFNMWLCGLLRGLIISGVISEEESIEIFVDNER